MAEQELEPELAKRLDLVNDPAYEGEPLRAMDYFLLVAVGVIIPIILMIWGWA